MSQIPPDESGAAAKLTELITRSHKQADDNALQQEAIQAAVNFIHSHGDEKHLFCNRDMYAVSVHALILFSFGEAGNEALDWYKKRIAQSLDSCTKCISLFQRGRVKLKEIFITDRGVDAENVESFSQSILAWEAKRLLPKFVNNLKLYMTEKEKTEKASVPRELLMCFVECLCGPGMLRLNPELRGLFDRVLFLLLSQDHNLVKTAAAITPGMIFLVMEGDEIQKRWSFKMFKELSKLDSPIKAPQVQQDVLEEFEHYLKFIQVPANNTDANKENFYRGLYALFEVVDEAAIIDKFLTFAQLRPITVDTDEPVLLTIFQCLRDHIMSYPDSSLPYILRFFQLVLLKVNDRFWSHIGEYTFQNIMGTIINNPNLIKGFALLKDTASFSGELNPASRISDLLNWIDPFLESLGFSQRLKSTETLTMFLITQLENQQSISLEVKAKLFIKACQLLSSALALPSQLYSPTLTTDLLARSDTRVVVNSKLVRFFDYGTSAAIFFPEFEREKNGDVVKAAIGVICKALRFDILTFAQNSYEIQKGKKPSTLRFSAQLFQAILKQSFPRQLELAYQLLCSMENVSTILPVGAQTAEVKEFLRYLSQFFVKFTDVDPKNTKMILSNHKSLKGYWACVFSPDESVYQSAVDVLYETFDAAGRLEGIHALLENSIDFCIQAVNDNLTNLIFIEFFEPCPRAVKVLTDVIQSLNSPRDGLLTDHENFNLSIRKSLVLFWNRCWKFLDLIYVQTIKWAEKYSDLVEFTRDTLDLSHSLLNCFKTIKKISDDGDSLKVFNEITNTFPHMLVWLRLSDPGLLASCVKLISSTVDLATDLDYKLDTTVIELLARYGSRAKKFNNRLTAAQSEEILDRARIFDAKLVDAVIHESEEYRKSKNGTPPSTTSTAGSTRETTPSSYTLSSSTAPPRMKVQMKVDNFGSLSKTAPVAPSKPKLPKSQLELARERLNAKKAVLAQSGTHRRREQQDSDDSDIEGDDAYALFNIKKPPKKAGITLLEDKWTQQRKLMQEKKKEEEYSRLRLNVDMKPLYKRVLQWSFLRNDDFPDSELNSLAPVADTFKNADDYIKTYEPLLLIECWSAICAAKNREDFKPMMISIGSKSSVNDFFEVFCSISKTMLSEKSITDSDLVVLAFSDKGMDHIPRVADVKKSTVSCFGKIHEIKHVKGDRADLTIRVSRSGSMNNWLNPHSTVMMMRVMQMTTIEREFSSLHGLRYYNLASQILEAKPNSPIDVSQSDMEKIRETYKVNDSQAKAIGSSVNTDGFSLIQGPPGTGKTKTILGVIGYMLSSFQASNVIAIPQGQKASLSPSPQDLKGKKVLVCAPSNAAVDELVLRMKDGIMNSRGDKYVPKLVRLGRSDAINSAVKDMTLEELVDAQLGKSSTITNNMDGLFKQLNEIKKKMEVCKIKIADEKNPAGDEVYEEKRELTKKANAIKQKLDEERERQNSHYRNREITRRNLQAKILSEADIICSTLSGSAHDMVANLGIKFDSVIIDEACQCTELSAVIPLRYGCKRCIMVGDPNQLPPTVLSSAAADALYDQSLFVRMAKNTKPLLLNVQYRMNSAISRFPSKMFYDSQLLDGPQNNALTTRVWHQNELFPPYKFYDIVDGQQLQNKKTFSFTNEVEVRIAIELIHKLFSTFNHLDFKNKIGIITPYKEQNRLLQKSFIREFGNNVKSEITFNTVDGFQGQEKDIIIMSCVRADAAAKGVGFLRDFRRMNVALTRPKCSMWILGHHDSLIKNNLWKSLIEDAKERNCLSEAREGFTSGAIKPSKPGVNKTHKAHILQKELTKEGKNSKLNGSGADSGHDPKPEETSTITANRSDSRSSELRPSEPLKPMNNGVLPPRDNTAPVAVSGKLPDPVPVRSSTVPSRPLPAGPMPKGPLAHSLPTGPSSSSKYPPVSRSGSLPPMPSNSGSLPPPHRPQQRKRPPQSSVFIQKRRRR
jgi:senataxin